MDSTVSTAASGLAAASMWMNAIASNVANMNDQSALSGQPGSTAQTPGSQTPGSQTPGSQTPGSQTPATFNPVTVTMSSTATGGVAATETPVMPAMVATYAPSSPHANARGLVGTPNVDLVTQMTDKDLAMQSNQANLDVLKTDNQMTRVTLNTVA